LTSHYPFDTYTGTLDLAILVSDTGSFNGNQNCDQLSNDPETPTTNAVFFVSLGQSLDGFKASIDTTSTGENGVITFTDGTSGTFGSGVVKVERYAIIRAFNVLLFIGE
jgi:hypothetical protein